MTLVLFLLGAVGFIMANIFSTTKRMRESVTMIVELKDGLSEAERDTVAVRLAESDMVASLKYVSKEEKATDEEFNRVFNVNIKGVLGENPLPDSYDVTLSAQSSDKAQLELFAEEARKIKGVEFVSYPQDLLEDMHATLDVMQFIMILFGGALLLVSFVLMNNTVRLAVYSQRELINTLKAVGATKWFIMRPFVRKSALQGVLSGILATVLLGGVIYALDHVIPGIGILPKWEEIGVFATVIVVTGVVVAVVCTLPVVNRFVNMKSNKIHLY
jgi:cell division transport system permease protein